MILQILHASCLSTSVGLQAAALALLAGLQAASISCVRETWPHLSRHAGILELAEALKVSLNPCMLFCIYLDVPTRASGTSVLSMWKCWSSTCHQACCLSAHSNGMHDAGCGSSLPTMAPGCICRIVSTWWCCSALLWVICCCDVASELTRRSKEGEFSVSSSPFQPSIYSKRPPHDSCHVTAALSVACMLCEWLQPWQCMFCWCMV